MVLAIGRERSLRAMSCALAGRAAAQARTMSAARVQNGDMDDPSPLAWGAAAAKRRHSPEVGKQQGREGGRARLLLREWRRHGLLLLSACRRGFASRNDDSDAPPPSLRAAREAIHKLGPGPWRTGNGDVLPAVAA